MTPLKTAGIYTGVSSGTPRAGVRPARMQARGVFVGWDT